MQELAESIARVATLKTEGRISGVRGLLVEIKGITPFLAVGSRLEVQARRGRVVPVEVIGFADDRALAMPYAGIEGIGVGAPVRLEQTDSEIVIGDAWLGRVVNAFGEPIDGKGPIGGAGLGMALKADPPQASQRRRVSGRVDLGVRALNNFVTICEGQRMGIFAGSGVGKSVLLSMIARFAEADVNVIGLVGERGREVQEFIEDDLGPEGLARSIVIVATSDESALMRRQAAYLTLTAAEYFRDKGKHVMCLMDSVTRFAMAQREIGLAGGEPPTTKGYTPTVFTELPRLLERAGPGKRDMGMITGIFTVLVEGDDHNEPVSDAVRGILDGHIVMERKIAERGRFPAINILRSVSRTMPGCHLPSENVLIREARRFMSTYADMEEMIRLGAYRQGTNPEVDAAIGYHQELEAFLGQLMTDQTSIDQGFETLHGILSQGPAEIPLNWAAAIAAEQADLS